MMGGISVGELPKVVAAKARIGYELTHASFHDKLCIPYFRWNATLSVNLTVGQIKALMALPLTKDASSDLLGARQALREAVNKASPEGRPSIPAEGETPKAAVVHAKRSETDAVADAKERMKPMGLDELKNVLAKNRLWVEMKAPNNGVLVMRIKNAIYNRINTGVQFKW